jgi:segregation and condensation protein B
MSLKAKLEAVIYAAEEPVTLAQLAALFATDALEWKAECAAAGAEVSPQTEPAGTLPLLDEGFAYLGLEQTPAFYTAGPPADGAPLPAPSAVEGAPADEKPDGTAGDESVAEAASTPIAQQEDTLEAQPGNPPASETGQTGEGESGSEADPKRDARSRDREVRAILRELIDELIASYAADDRGIEIREIAGGYRVATKPECHDAVRQFVRSLKPPLKLSLPALETLAIVAYKQPVTAPEVSEIRGVESAGTLGSLLSRKLIATAGRKQVIGRPILYKTTREFLLRFGLKDVSELPSMEEFEKMAAIELDEQAPAEEDANGAELSEGASEEVELTDSFERTSDETAQESAQSDESQDTASPESARTASGTSEFAETEASPHEK